MPGHAPTAPVVSVLMVARDAEGSVRRAVESVQNQSLSELELVVVDAGSRDATLRQLEAIAERDLRVEVVRADRCGRQRALGLALERARGAYLVVMDADGWARPSMLADMVGLARERALELVVGGIELSVSVAEGRPSEVELSAEAEVFPAQHEFRAAAWRLLSSGLLLPASAKLFERSRVGEVGASFSPDHATDHSFTIGYLRDVERVGVLGGTCYHVGRVLGAGVRRDAGNEGYRRLEAEQDALVSLYRHWGLEGDVSSMEMLQSRYIEQLVGCVEGACGRGTGLSSGEQRRLVANMIGTERARVASSVARPRSNDARSLLAPIRSGNVALVCAQARLMGLLSRGRVANVVPDVYL